MPVVVGGLCAAASTWCAAILLRAHSRRANRILLWSSLAFIGLAIQNALLFADLVVDQDLSYWRAVVGAAAMLILVAGLIWDTE